MASLWRAQRHLSRFALSVIVGPCFELAEQFLSALRLRGPRAVLAHGPGASRKKGGAMGAQEILTRLDTERAERVKESDRRRWPSNRG